MQKVSLYQDGKPWPKWLKITVTAGAALIMLAYIYGQYITNFYLDGFNKVYSLSEEVKIHQIEDVNSPVIGKLKLWQSVMVPAENKTDFAEVDRPIHGFVAKRFLGSFEKMNEEREVRGLPAKMFR